MRYLWTLLSMALSAGIGIAVRLFTAPTIFYTPAELHGFAAVKFYLHYTVGGVWSWPLVLSLCLLGGALILASRFFAASTPWRTLRLVGLNLWVLAWMPFVGIVMAALAIVFALRSMSASTGHPLWLSRNPAWNTAGERLYSPTNQQYRRTLGIIFGVLGAASLVMVLLSINTTQPWIIYNRQAYTHDVMYTVTLAIQLACLVVFLAGAAESLRVGDSDGSIRSESPR